MAEKEQILKEELEYSGLFDFAGLYSYAHTWFVDEKHSVDEERYAEKTSGNSKDIDIEWKVVKKLSDYFKTEYKVVYGIKELTDVEVEIDGRKKMMNKGKLKIKVTGILVMDYESKWETSPFSRFMRDVYNKYVVPGRVGAVRERIFGTVTQFKDSVKAYLSLSARR